MYTCSHCNHFNPIKKFPQGHPDLGKCKGCTFGDSGTWGEDCPLRAIKEPPKPEERIENKAVVVGKKTKHVLDEDGGEYATEVEIVVEVPHRAVYHRIGDGYGNYRWTIGRWEPLRELTEEEFVEQ